MPVHLKLSLGKKSWEYGQPIAPQPSIFGSQTHELFPVRQDPFPYSLDPFSFASSHGFGRDFFDLGPQTPPEMQAVLHAQREQLQASPLGPHMREMGMLPPRSLCAEFGGGSMPYSAPSTHPLDAVVVEDAQRESLGGHYASCDGEQDVTETKKSPTSSKVSLANTCGDNSPPPPLPLRPIPATVIHESRTQKVKTVFRGLKLSFLSIGYKVSVIHN